VSLADEPLRGKPLRGDLAHLRSLRVGAYRILYRFDARAKAVTVHTIRHRSEAYRRAR
jgi:mRNA-degrading endonuclease RelE of RelBE toxin-antitoxin system